MTFDVVLHSTKIYVIIMIAFIAFFFYQNRFMNDCARKNIAKTPEGQEDGLT